MLYTLIFLQYFNISLVITTMSPVRAPAMCHAPWIQPAMDSDSSAREAALHKKREGIKNIATVTVLKKERPDSLGADIHVF